MSVSCAATTASRAPQARRDKRSDRTEAGPRWCTTAAIWASWSTKRDAKGLPGGWAPDRQRARGAAGTPRRRVTDRHAHDARLPCTSNVKSAAVVRCECIEDDVNHVYYADGLLDRINLLSGGTIGVPWATSHAQPKGLGPVARSLPVPPKSMADGGEIGRFRVVSAPIFGKMGQMDLLGGYTKQGWDWYGVNGPIVAPRTAYGKTWQKPGTLDHALTALLRPPPFQRRWPSQHQSPISTSATAPAHARPTRRTRSPHRAHGPSTRISAREAGAFAHLRRLWRTFSTAPERQNRKLIHSPPAFGLRWETEQT